MSSNSIHVCPKRNALSDSNNSVPVNVGITFDPTFSERWGYKRAFVGGKMSYPGDGICRDGSQ